MKALLNFELGNFFKKAGLYIFGLLLLLLGFAVGSNFSLGAGPDIFKNSPYLIAHMTGFLSLLCIFFVAIFSAQILFREKDSHFNLILYATPIRKKDYLWSRLIAVVIICCICFAMVVIGFAIGQIMHSDNGIYRDARLSFYWLPLVLFGFINTIFCSTVICGVAWLTNNKLLVYVTGLFIYILYMVMLIYSRSPMMAQSMPQSADAAQLSALLDPFGLSAFFMQTANWSVQQRNTAVIIPAGAFLFNRIAVLLLSAASIAVAFKYFTFSIREQKKRRQSADVSSGTTHPMTVFKAVQPTHGWLMHWASLISFTRIHVTYITRSIPFVLTTIGLLFYVAMEINGHIKGGIRFPERYATSGLMVNRILGGFHGLCLIVILYYANEIDWRSRSSRFEMMENATPVNPGVLFFSKWITLSCIIFFFGTMMVALGLVFQFIYQYSYIDWEAYGGIYLFNGMPLVISAGIILLVQKLVNHKIAGLMVSSAVILLTATSMGRKLLSYPLLQFQVPFKGLHSDMNGFGPYTAYYGWKIIFGICITLAVAILVTQMKKFRIKPWLLLPLLMLSLSGFMAAVNLLQDYRPVNKEAALLTQVTYETLYRKFQHLPQPAVIDIKTTIDLYPEENAYEVKATYVIQNKTNQPITDVLINFEDELKIYEAYISNGTGIVPCGNHTGIITLQKALQPNDTASFYCHFSYHWKPVNGHQSFNAIVENGAFMRISRYFPSFGYLSDKEITANNDRKKFQLEKTTPVASINAPKDSTDDFMNLEMTISTSNKQTAIGVGELIKKWHTRNRNYFQYKTPGPVPFRFAVSSAEYAVHTTRYKDKNIEVYYHPLHVENVAHLVKNIQLTLDYCETNFGAYPFKTIRFAEVSTFTKGFNATAYPATVFMTEDMAFHANIKADKQQDLINELAGHELAHMWWGNSQLAPAAREGDVLLTEALAQYTELMLVKKMHGQKSVLDNVRLHLDLYLNGRGYTDEQPLFTMLSQNVHLSYSKSAVVMYQLAEMIGEEKVNTALKQLLQKNAWPHPRAVSTDLIRELYAVTDIRLHDKIDDLFKRITFYEFKVTGTTLKKTASGHALTITALANKYYEDGKGNRTNAAFNDTVAIAVYSKQGKETIWRLHIVNGKIAGTLQLTEVPESILVDPKWEFIKKEGTNRIPLAK
jgi:ABC-2 type transport system permease protein